MNNELKIQAYSTMLKYPAWSDEKIANDIGISRPTVWRLRKKLIGTIDWELAQRIAGQFLTDYQMASDYYKQQITELEDMKKEHIESKVGGTKTIYKKGKDGQSYAEEVELNTFDILEIDKDIRSIMKQQQELWRDIMFLARQGQGAEVMKMIASGRIQLPPQ